MFKEFLICVVIVIFIFTLDMITQKYTENNLELLIENLNDIREDILNNKSKNEILQEMKDIKGKWDNVHEKMAYYIEHDELEKVETVLVTIKSYIEMDDNVMAISMIDECSFIMKHIKDKYDFNLENVF